MKDKTRDEYMAIISGLTERKDYAEQKMLEADALAGKQVNRADDLQDDLDREKENVRILKAKAKEADEIIAKKFADWTASAGESRLIRVAFERVMGGESAKSIAKDYGLDADTFNRATRLKQERDTLKGEVEIQKERKEESYTAAAELNRMLVESNAQVERLQSALRRSIGVGHNLDCMFCGFKDKVAFEAIGDGVPEALQDTETDTQETECKRIKNQDAVCDCHHCVDPDPLEYEKEKLEGTDHAGPIDTQPPKPCDIKNYPVCKECEHNGECLEVPSPSVGGRVEKKTDCCWWWDNHPDHPDAITTPGEAIDRLVGEDCPTCGGRGEVFWPYDSPEDMASCTAKDKCPNPECVDGKIPKPSEDCPECDGFGEIYDKHGTGARPYPCPKCKPGKGGSDDRPVE